MIVSSCRIRVDLIEFKEKTSAVFTSFCICICGVGWDALDASIKSICVIRWSDDPKQNPYLVSCTRKRDREREY